MITIGVLAGSGCAGRMPHMILELCSQAKERGNMNLIFFTDSLYSDFCGESGGRQEQDEEDALSFADAFVICGQKMPVKRTGQQEGAPVPFLPARIPYVLFRDGDSAGRVLDQACAAAEGCPADRPAGFTGRGDSKEVRRSHFEQALQFAMAAHKGQVRKGSSVPYIVHPIETALIAMTLTRDQDVIIAALFHDIIEDTQYGAKDIEKNFGGRIAQLVKGVSENKRRGQDASETWKIRKQEFIDSLDSQSREEKIIALSDKLSNMRATCQGYRKNGENFWLRFHEKRKEMHFWYYRTVTDKLREFENTNAWQELDRLVREIFGG